MLIRFPVQSETRKAFAPNYGARLRAGMIVPAQNTIAEADAHHLVPEGVSVLTARVPLRSDKPEDLHATGDEAVAAAKLLAMARPNSIVFHCTAASTVDPHAGERVAERIAASTGVPSFATSQALIAALRALKAKRIVMLTPYAQATNDAEVRFFGYHDIEVIREIGLNLAAQRKSMSDVSMQEWHDQMLALRHPDTDAYFLSCTNIRALSVIDALEPMLDAPVITSNQVMLWHLLRSSGIEDRIAGYGRLLNSL